MPQTEVSRALLPVGAMCNPRRPVETEADKEEESPTVSISWDTIVIRSSQSRFHGHLCPVDPVAWHSSLVQSGHPVHPCQGIKAFTVSVNEAPIHIYN
jgi:hypothetical protein